MRDWTGIDFSSLPPSTAPDFLPRARRMFGDIDYFLRDLSRGVKRIQDGEVPDGSGNPIGNGGTLTDYWFKPGISEPFIAYMSTGASAGGNISSTSHDDKGFVTLGYPTGVVYVDESGFLTGLNVSSPAAALHVQPGVSGTTTLVPSSSVVHNWDSQNRTGPGGTNAGAFTIASLATNDDDTLYNGVNDGTLGNNPETVGMSGTITPNKTWTVTLRLRALGSTITSDGNAEFHIVDSTGAKFTKTGLTGMLTGLTTSWTTFTFDLDCTSGSSGSGTANTCIIGLSGKAGLLGEYICCTYFEISTGGSSDIARWNNDASALSGKITKDGYLGVGTGSDALSAMETIKIGSSSQVGEIIYGAASQTGNLFEWRNSSLALLSRIKSDGTFEGPITANPMTTTDANFTITGSSDATKTLKFELDGATAGADLVVDYRSAADRSLIWSLAGSAGNDLTLSTTLTGDRVITIPDVTGTLPTIENAATITGPWTLTPGTSGNDVAVVAVAGGAGIGFGAFKIQDSGSGFAMEIAPLSAGFTGDRLISLPDASGDLVLANGAQTLQNKTLQTNCLLNATSAATGVAFQDTTTSTKKLRMILSGASASTNSALSFTSTASRTFTFPDHAVTIVGLVATANLTAQSAAKTATTLYAVPSNGQGLYEVAYVATVTTAASTSSVLGGTNGFQLTFTDPNDSVAKTSNHTTVISSAGNTTATTISGVFAAYCKASTNLQYAFDYTSVGGTAMQYDLRVTATFIG